MTSIRDGTTQDHAAQDDVVTSGTSGVPASPLREAIERHPTALVRHLDSYLAAVAQELQVQGVLTGSPQRTDPTHRLIGSIVLDCTTLRIAAWTPTDGQPADQQSLGDAIHPERPAPVVVTWDELTGWCVGLHHDSTHASRRYLHPDLLPTAQAVADFVVGLALGQPLGAPHPINTPAPDRPQLRLVLCQPRQPDQGRAVPPEHPGSPIDVGSAGHPRVGSDQDGSDPDPGARHHAAAASRAGRSTGREAQRTSSVPSR